MKLVHTNMRPAATGPLAMRKERHFSLSIYIIIMVAMSYRTCQWSR